MQFAILVFDPMQLGQESIHIMISIDLTQTCPHNTLHLD